MRAAAHYGVYLPPLVFAAGYPGYNYLANLILLVLLVVAFAELVRLELPRWAATPAVEPQLQPRPLTGSG